jgi:hypothetical protein
MGVLEVTLDGHVPKRRRITDSKASLSEIHSYNHQNHRH